MERSDARNYLLHLKQRILHNIRVQEGDQPQEDPAELMEQMEELLDRQASLIRRINRTNVNTWVDESQTIADAIARRDMLKLKISIYRETAHEAGISPGRQTRSEIRYVTLVKAKEIQQKADQLAKEYRELDAAIQALNWNTELME